MISGSDPSSNSVASISHPSTGDTRASLRKLKYKSLPSIHDHTVLSVICLFLLLQVQVTPVHSEYVHRPQPDYDETGAIEGVECIANGKFYRNPEFKNGVRDCAKYYWCPRGKVLEFRCSAGLWFDVDRQICDFKAKVRNCEKSHGECKLPINLIVTVLLCTIHSMCANQREN